MGLKTWDYECNDTFMHFIFPNLFLFHRPFTHKSYNVTQEHNTVE